MKYNRFYRDGLFKFLKSFVANDFSIFGGIVFKQFVKKNGYNIKFSNEFSIKIDELDKFFYGRNFSFIFEFKSIFNLFDFRKIYANFIRN